MTLHEELEERGFIHQTSADITEILDGPKRTIYFGVDPTAESIHAGNFVGYMLLRHLAQAGHKVIMLAGGATGRIGDPKPDVERPLLPEEEITRRVEKLQAQAKHLIGVDDLTIVNNYDWFKDINLLDFLRDVGKHFTVNELMKKEAIAKRLTSEIGLSYTEFAYPLIQGYDYLELYRKFGCDVQIGGSDQWGNIVAGVDLVRRKEQATVYAVTLPLVVDKATGKKFGKSEGNAVWLDPEKTSPYEFYQFWLNTSDENVIDYLKLFTFAPLVMIEVMRESIEKYPEQRGGQKWLAHLVTTLVHGEDAAQAAAEVSGVLFGGTLLSEVSDQAKDMILTTAPTHTVSVGDSLVDVLADSGLATSKREARTFIESGAISLDGQKIESIDATVPDTKHQILKRGKKQLCVLVVG